jgi:outer membrane protein OmpA-like peptidoglycan-associated protein
MDMNRKTLVAVAVLAAIGAAPTATFAQDVERTEAIASSDVLSQISMYSYRESRKSDLFFRGTPIAANAQGKAQVEYQDGNAHIFAEVENLPEPASLGPYTTYVLWALTPDGRATNQGVIGGPSGGSGEVETQYGAPQFALIVTAEPHFAVTMPSTMIALYNVGDDVKGNESKVTTLTERADYTMLTKATLGHTIDDDNPVEIVQARYAIAIARAAGADRFASQSFESANQKLTAAETALSGKRSERRTAPGLAREALVAGEDARRSAMLASADADARAEQVAAADAATQAANASARVAATEAAAGAEAAATEAATAAAAATEAATGVERDNAAAAAREDLRNRLNAALPTRDSDRGLISEIGGVQFATGTADANASGRESLAKFSGVVASYPGLRFKVEGHTDSVGSVALNNELSLRRAITVRDYLIGQGVAASSIDVAGLGLSMPIGDNSTVDGRARNRRVEIVIAGGPLTASADSVRTPSPAEAPAGR